MVGWWLHPPAEASSAALPLRAAWDGRFSAKRCCGQPQSPRAGIRPRVEREGRTHAGAAGTGDSKGKQEGSSLGAPLLPGQHRGTSFPVLPSPGYQRGPAHLWSLCRRPLAPTKDRKGRTPCGLNSGLPQKVGSTLAPQEGGRPWQCCVGVSGEALRPWDALSTWHREQSAAHWREGKPSMVRLVEPALDLLSKSHYSLLQTKPKPAPGREDGII